jgi:hypothetical protein
MSKVKIYDDTQVITDLLKCLSNDIINGNNMLASFNKALLEVSPVMRCTVIRDMWKFINCWHETVNSVNMVKNKKVLTNIFTLSFIMQRINLFIDTIKVFNVEYPEMQAEEISDEELKENEIYIKYSKLTSYIACIIKAVIQTTRRKHGLDNNPQLSIRKQVNPFVNKK